MPSSSSSTTRHIALCNALDIIVTSLVEDIREARETGVPGQTARALTTLRDVAAQGLLMQQALGGARRYNRTQDVGTEAPDTADVQPGTGQGIYQGALGPLQQFAETHGQRVINELLTLGRNYVAQAHRPSLDEFSVAISAARRRGDEDEVARLLAGAESFFGVEFVRHYWPSDARGPTPTTEGVPSVDDEVDFEEVCPPSSATWGDPGTSHEQE